MFPSVRDFHYLFCNSSSKTRLQTFLQTAFEKTAADVSKNVKIIFCVVGSSPSNLTTGMPVPEFKCNHAEVTQPCSLCIVLFSQ